MVDHIIFATFMQVIMRLLPRTIYSLLVPSHKLGPRQTWCLSKPKKKKNYFSKFQRRVKHKVKKDTWWIEIYNILDFLGRTIGHLLLGKIVCGFWPCKSCFRRYGGFIKDILSIWNCEGLNLLCNFQQFNSDRFSTKRKKLTPVATTLSSFKEWTKTSHYARNAEVYKWALLWINSHLDWRILKVSWPKTLAKYPQLNAPIKTSNNASDAAIVNGRYSR